MKDKSGGFVLEGAEPLFRVGVPTVISVSRRAVVLHYEVLEYRLGGHLSATPDFSSSFKFPYSVSMCVEGGVDMLRAQAGKSSRACGMGSEARWT